jgi:uncharacterized membrane protein YdjX (TVP38/TMEM64 family)
VYSALLYFEIAVNNGAKITNYFAELYANAGKYDQAKAFYKIFDLILKYGWKSSFIAHINPLLPGSSIGFIFGASSLNFRSFMSMSM